MTEDLTVRQLASLGGQARAKQLGRKRRQAIAASGGTAAQAKISTAERKRRAKKAWETRRAKLAGSSQIPTR
jgi:hypothetical protein